MRKLLYAIMICLIFIAFGAGIWTGFLIHDKSSKTAVVLPSGEAEFKLVEQAWNTTEDNYVDTNATQPQRLAYSTISGMIDSLGDTGHSTFLTPAEVKQANDFEQGQFAGVGLEIQEKNNHIVVVAPIEGSPAQQAGIHSGDVILKVDGQPITDIADAVQHIMGRPGTSVTLTIQVASGETRDITVVRAEIKIPAVSWQQLPDTSIVHLRLSSFSKGIAAQLDGVLSAIEKQGETGIILDLRDNPGGLLDEAVAVISRFISKGNALLIKDAHGKITPVPVITGTRVINLRMVVLLNKGTASAAEIVAGALHDAGRARLAGETSFGTGTVLQQFTLADGSAILLAVQEWLTPSGSTIWHVGLTPDKVISLANDVTPLFPEEEKNMTLAQIKAGGDQQLLSALDLLQ